jgi:hypothetical protein
VLLAGAGTTPLLNAARLLDAAAQSQPLDSSSSSSTVAADEAVHRRRQQAVMKSLKPFVALTGSMGQGQPGDAAEQQQLVMVLVQQCQEQLGRCDTQPACGVTLSPGHFYCSKKIIDPNQTVAMDMLHNRLMPSTSRTQLAYEVALT